MELFLLFAIAITIVAFIPIVISKPIPSLNTSGFIELDAHVSQIDFISPEPSNVIELLPLNMPNKQWEVNEFSNLQDFFIVEEA